MKWNKKISKKEKREIILIVFSVMLVAVIGLVVTMLASDRTEAIAGQAGLDPNFPTDPGVLILIKDYCHETTGSGTCDNVCGEEVCVPLEENCDLEVTENRCFCCTVPE